jgi:hypothetical protein
MAGDFLDIMVRPSCCRAVSAGGVVILMVRSSAPRAMLSLICGKGRQMLMPPP